MVGRAELAIMVESINEMLDHLDIYNQKLVMSEGRFRAIFETAEDCIFIKDRESKYVQVNPAMERIFEIPALAILGKGDEALFSPEIALEIRKADSRVLSGNVVVGEVQRDAAEGVSITFHVAKVPLRDDLGRIVGICGIARDITERINSEIELKNRELLLSIVAVIANNLLISEDLNSAVVDSLQLLAEAIGADGGVVFEIKYDPGEPFATLLYQWGEDIDSQIDNPAFQNLQLSDNAIIVPLFSKGRPYQGLVKNLPEAERTMLRALGMVSFFCVPITIQDRLWGFLGFFDCHSERVWSKNEISVLQSAAGNIGGAIVRSRTREDLVRARDELERRIDEAEAKNAEMERFVYTVSHDLRSPLVTIQGFAGFLREDISEDNRDKIDTDLRMIEEAVVNMDHLLKDTLELSRIGRVASPPEDASFGDIVHESLDRFSAEIGSKGVEVVLAESWPKVRVDRLRIQEVLMNLIENGLKYMGNESNPEIEIGWRREGDETIFFIRDNGTGIEADQQEKVFDLFYKLDPDTEGSGVGLAIVKRIIEVHNGRIWIESEVGTGTTFFFNLPTVEARS